MKTIQEQIADWEAKRLTLASEMETMMSKAAEESRALNKDEADEYDAKKDELDEIGKHIDRLKDLQKVQLAKAQRIEDVKDVQSGSDKRGDDAERQRPIITMSRRKVEPGIGFVRFILASSVAKFHGPGHALALAKTWRDSTPEVELAIKTAVDPGITTDSTWAQPLVYAQNLAAEFAEFLRPLTILGRIPGLRRVPFNVRIPRQTQGSTVGWVGESKPKPVSELAFDSVTLTWAKIAGIVTFSKELRRLSDPNVEILVRDDLARSIVQYQDAQLLDPDVSAVANVSPASLTNGVTPTQASGATADALIQDFGDLIATFVAANMSLGSTVLVMSQTLASFISLMRTSLAVREFPDISRDGGNLLGFPVVTSENISTGMIVMIKADEVLLAEDPAIEIDISEEASVQMNSAPDSPVTASTVYRSLWQHNEIGVRAEKLVTWAKRRSGAVQFIANAGYGGAPGGSGT